jgi:hypothetical protein
MPRFFNSLATRSWPKGGCSMGRTELSIGAELWVWLRIDDFAWPRQGRPPAGQADQSTISQFIEIAPEPQLIPNL